MAIGQVVTVGDEQFVVLPPEFSDFGPAVELTRAGDGYIVSSSTASAPPDQIESVVLNGTEFRSFNVGSSGDGE